jgi:hypothetical protein
VQHAAAAFRTVESVPALARANLLAAALPGMDEPAANELPTAILELAALQEACDAERVRVLINEERAVAGFPEVRETSAVAEALAERRRHYRTALKEALEVLPPLKLVRVVTQVVTEATARGTRPAPALIDDLVDTYEVEAQRFLEAEARNVELLVQGVREGVAKNRQREILKRLLSRIQDVVLNWDRVAQPIQLSAMSRGLDHALSHQVALQVRSLAVDLYNEHGMLEESRYLTNLLRNAFGEVPRVAEMTSEDEQALQEIARKREAAQQQWVHDISYSNYVGTSVTMLFEISPQGINWQGTRWPLDSITSLQWGGVMGPNGENPRFLITFGNGSATTTVSTYDANVFTAITQKLWIAVGRRLLIDMVTELGKGKRFVFGDAVVDDQGVEFTHKSHGGPQSQYGWGTLSRVRVNWSYLQVETSNGVFRLKHKADPGTCVELPYLSVNNVHVLETAIRNLLETPTPVLMSDLLRN